MLRNSFDVVFVRTSIVHESTQDHSRDRANNTQFFFKNKVQADLRNGSNYHIFLQTLPPHRVNSGLYLYETKLICLSKRYNTFCTVENIWHQYSYS